VEQNKEQDSLLDSSFREKSLLQCNSIWNKC